MIITVWGSSGSGKSTFSTLLARELAKKRQVLLVNFDMNTPMMPVWLPKKEISRKKSLGHLFGALEINTDVLAGAIVVPDGQKNLGLLSYLLQDRFMDFAEESREKLVGLIRAAEQLADVVVLDVTPDFASPVLPLALEMADQAYCLLTPELRGAVYYESAKCILADSPKFRWQEIRMILSPVEPFHAVEAMEGITGKLYGILPYTEDLDISCGEGKLLTAPIPKKYRRIVEQIVKEIKNE